MQFDVLGRMCVTDRTGTRPVTGMRHRVLLGALLAHDQCGRQAEALAAYQDARGKLVEELGGINRHSGWPSW
jgi:hypothetical protein